MEEEEEEEEEEELLIPLNNKYDIQMQLDQSWLPQNCGAHRAGN